MSKYEPLWNWIQENGTDSFAYKKELTEYGFMVGKISMKEQTVSFERLKSKSMLSEKRWMK